jgi:DNA mismatch repair protein MutS
MMIRIICRHPCRLKYERSMTPLMKQYWEIKSAHPDKVVLFRMGDFYEMFHDDAITAAPILSITLTSRNKKAQDETPMCGVPHHSVAGPINKLLSCGHKVAICDQLEDPKLAKGIVKRGVTRILTPGMVFDPDSLESDRSNYIAAFDDTQICFVECSTFEAIYFEVRGSEIHRLMQMMGPREVVVTAKQEVVCKSWALDSRPCVSVFDGGDGSAQIRLLKYIEHALPSFEVKSLVFERREFYERMRLSAQVLKHLEIFETHSGSKQGSLFWAVDRTKTSLGARLLKSWMAFPLVKKEPLIARQQKVKEWSQNHARLEEIRQDLATVGDLERRACKFYLPSCSGRDLLSLSEMAVAAVKILKVHSKDNSARFESIEKDALKAISALCENQPISVKEGGLFQKGFDKNLDEYIGLTSNLEEKLLEIEARERETTRISSLKVKYNSVFGFFIEVTNAQSQKVPGHYLRKQTLSGAERFTTDELTQLESKILTARSKRVELEYDIFLDFKRGVLKSIRSYLELAAGIAELDVLTSLAWLANEQKLVAPEFVDIDDKSDNQARNITLRELRHPVVEQLLCESRKTFVANDFNLSVGDGILLTGPNMAGKSTLMRSLACAVLMGQIGSFVAAASAKLPLFQSLWTRIGASDALSEGLSTFMVEMKESAEILKNADMASLVILDEIGRGTSTFDGMSLAQAILEHLVLEKKSTLLFATHYHELTSLAEKLPHLTNAHMQIKEGHGKMEFVYRLRPGPAGQSYGIHVGSLAGLPSTVISRAQHLLQQFESAPVAQTASQMTPQMDLFAQAERPVERVELKSEQVLTEIKELDVSRLTPLMALVKISEFQENLS